MRKIQILGVVSFIGLASIYHAYASDINNERKEYASLSSQPHYATKEQVLGYLEGLRLEQEARSYGREGISIMFDERFPQPPHSIKTVNNGWKCLLDRLQKVTSASEQIGELNKTFKLHRNSISNFDPQFSKEIPEMFCEECKIAAYKENGLRKNY